jgi:hypothetical protein
VELHLSIAQEFVQRVQLVGLEVVNFLNAGVHQYFQTMDAWCVGDVYRRILDVGAVLRRLGDGVHLGMDRAKAVLLGVAIGRFRLVNQTANVGAVGHPGGRAIVTGGENILIPSDNGADFGARACRSLGHLQSDRHEVLIPAQPFAHNIPSSATIL